MIARIIRASIAHRGLVLLAALVLALAPFLRPEHYGGGGGGGGGGSVGAAAAPAGGASA